MRKRDLSVKSRSRKFTYCRLCALASCDMLVLPQATSTLVRVINSVVCSRVVRAIRQQRGLALNLDALYVDGPCYSYKRELNFSCTQPINARFFWGAKHYITNAFVNGQYTCERQKFHVPLHRLTRYFV